MGSDNMPKQNSITFTCMFEAYGMTSDRNPLYGIFKVGEVPENNILYIDDKYFPNVSDLDLKRYALRPIIGFLKNGDHVFKNAKMTIYDKNHIIKQECYTDSAGMYKLYLVPGIYDIEILYNNKITYLKDQKIKDGLTHTFYLKTKATIKKHYKDISIFTNSNYLYIRGQIVDENSRPYQADIIIYDNTYIYTYYKTDKEGHYQFSLKPGNYTVMICSEKTNTKTFDITFNADFGFSEQLKPQDQMIMSL